MQENHWQKIETVFNEAAALPVSERKALVKQRCADDEELYRQIWQLVEDDINENEFLQEPIFTLGAQIIESEYLETPDHVEFVNYKLQKLLGRGGMGAVYLAEDTRLGRSVAIKVLPPALSENKESLSRFRHEARAASAISHPNIAHIYEFGETNGRLFLAMEYVEGQTVRELLKEKSLDVWLALDIAKQVAAALISTHKRGIIHRDIKPENIIVKDNGLVKVLDFGLAKLTEEREKALIDSQAFTLSQMYTQSGMILGTVGYMSPEQIRNKKLDASTDLWSLGVVLFEMLTGKRPFQGETISDVQAAILKDELLLPSEPGSAANTNQIIKKALTKNIAERYKSAREFAEDVERIQLELNPKFHDSHRYFAVNKTAESSNKYLASANPTNGILPRQLVLPVILILTIVAGWLIFQFTAQRNSVSDNSSQMRMSRLTNSGNAVRAALSPDGQTLAYVLGLRGVFLRRRTASGTFLPEAITLVAPVEEQQIRGLAFTPDGRQIFFRAKTSGDAVHHLFRVSVDGGEPQKIVNDVQSPPSFSPDGKQMVFLRANQDNSRGDLIISDADGSNERVFYTRRSPDFFSVQAQPAWSPDGNTILCSTATKTGNRELMLPLAIRVSDGQTQPVLKEPWKQIWTTQWLGDGKSFVMTGRPDITTDNNQIWRVSFPDGEITRVTDDFNDYFGVSVTNSSGGRAVEMTSVILNRTSQLWKVSLANPAEPPQQVTESGGDDGYGISWARSGDQIFYGSRASGNPDIWTMSADGAGRRQLTLDSHLDSQPSLSPDGRYVIFGSLRSGIESLWRMNADGSEQTLLVSDALREPLAITPGGTIYYHSTAGGEAAMWRVSVEGGKQPERVINGKYFPSAVSPDGRFLAASVRPEGAKAYSIALLAIEENSPPRLTREFKPAEGADLPDWLRWSPDGASINYTVTKKGTGNLYSQPIDGSNPKQLTNFTSNRIYSFDFSSDGKQIICSRGELSGYVALLTTK